MRKATPRRKIALEDLFRLRLISGIDLSPDGEFACLSLARTDRDADRTRKSLYLVEVGSGAVRRLTHGERADGAPRFTPCGGHLLFASDRDKPARLYRLPLSGGEAEPLGDETGRFSAIVPSPDGSRVAIVFTPEPPPPQAGAARPPLRIIRLRHKENGSLFLPETRAVLAMVDVKSGRTTRILEARDEIDAPVFSPDGKSVVFAANFDRDADLRRDTRHLYRIPAAGGRPVKITRTPGPKGCPAFSPDGRMLAWIGHEGGEGYHGVENHRPYVLDLASGRIRALASDLDRNAQVSVVGDARGSGGGQNLRFSGDGRDLYFLVSSEGTVHLHRAAVKTGKAVAVSSGACSVLAMASCAKARRFALVVADARNPGDLYLAERDGATRRLTAFNDELLESLDLSAPEEIVADSDGRRVQGWLLLPPEAPRKGKVPAILQIHGGPHAMYGHAFFHEFQLLAAQGYAVAYANPCGSQGYGREFAAAAMRRWGGPDYDDLMAFADRVAAHPRVDAKRFGVTGGSYGGYMTNWIVGRTDRFRAAVTHRSLSNLISFFGASDCGWEFIPEFGGTPWEKPDEYLAASPIMRAARIRTPLLIVHSDEDIRTPIEQAEQLFTALKLLGRDVEMLRFFGENHDLSRTGRPSNRAARLEAILDWFGRKL